MSGDTRHSTDRRRYLRTYQRQWIARRRAAWFAVNGPCVDCGSWERLELDHVDPERKIHHGVWSWSEPRREAELAKCQALCNDCHLEKTIQEHHLRWGERGHGHRKTYDKGCRCDPCRVAKSVYMAAYRARVRARHQRPAAA